MKRLNLGCGTNLKDGWVNADKFKTRPSVTVMEMEKRFPWPANYFDEVYARHALEHSRDIEFTLEEIKRVTKKNGVVRIIVPHLSSPRAISDLGHYSYWDSTSFAKQQRASKRSYQQKNFFKVKSVLFTRIYTPMFLGFLRGFMLGFANKHNEFWEMTGKSFFPILEIEYVLLVDK